MRKHAWISGVLGVVIASQAWAQSLVRDEEIERYVERLAAPIFEAGGLDPEAVDVYLIADRRLNAFVAGGQNLFLNTGLLARAETPGQLAGVIAHETGHISAGHLSRVGEAIERAAIDSLIASALGVAAAVAGAPQLAVAIFAGGSTLAERGLLRFSRAQEQAADLAGAQLMRAVGRDPRGLVEFLDILAQEAALAGLGDGAEYLRSHPLTRNRIAALRRTIEAMDAPAREPSPEELAAHERMRAKLDGFLLDAERLERRYGGREDPNARYALAISAFRAGDLRAAAAVFREMIEAAPEDPFLHELLGQALFESGEVEAAIEPYREARSRAPGSALIRFGLGRALIEAGGEARLEEARLELSEAVRIEPANAAAWRALGVALGRSGRETEAALALAEHAVLRRDVEAAELHLERASAGVAPGSPEEVRIADLRRSLDAVSRPRR